MFAGNQDWSIVREQVRQQLIEDEEYRKEVEAFVKEEEQMINEFKDELDRNGVGEILKKLGYTLCDQVHSFDSVFFCYSSHKRGDCAAHSEGYVSFRIGKEYRDYTFEEMKQEGWKLCD